MIKNTTVIKNTAVLFVCLFVIFFPAESNKVIIMQSGAIHVLIRLLKSPNREIQCNACGCITTLATTGMENTVIYKYT